MIIKRVTELETDWKEIKAAADAGNLRELLFSGDRIPLKLKTGEEVELDVTYDEHGKCFFVTHDCLEDLHSMNSRATNAGGWAASGMRKYLNEDILEAFPDELKEIIVPTKIIQIVDGKRIECEDKLFCLSRTQVAGEGWWTEYEPEDTRLDIFTDDRSRIKMSAGAVSSWWERSPHVYLSNHFAFVYTSGYPNIYTSANSAYGVCLGFCIQKSHNNPAR